MIKLFEFLMAGCITLAVASGFGAADPNTGRQFFIKAYVAGPGGTAVYRYKGDPQHPAVFPDKVSCEAARTTDEQFLKTFSEMKDEVATLFGEGTHVSSACKPDNEL